MVEIGIICNCACAASQPSRFSSITVDLLYAVEFAEGNTPAWRRLTTPALMITTTSTLDHGEQPLQGDIQQETGWTSLAGKCAALAAGAFVLVTTLLFIAVNRTIRYLTRPRTVGANLVAWQQFDEIFGPRQSKWICAR